MEIIIPKSDMPTAYKALEDWVALVQATAGEPVFREVVKGGRISPMRLSDRSVARIIKRRVYVRVVQLGGSDVEAHELATICSGHSLRAGFCTAAADKMPEWKIRKRSRHKTAELVARYVRAVEEWNESGLRGVGF